MVDDEDFVRLKASSLCGEENQINIFQLIKPENCFIDIFSTSGQTKHSIKRQTKINTLHARTHKYQPLTSEMRIRRSKTTTVAVAMQFQWMRFRFCETFFFR